MIGDTVSIVYDTVTHVLNKINQDNYTSEYYKRTATEEYRLRVRHSNETVSPGKPAFERHNAVLTRVVFATTTVPQRTYEVSTVIRLEKGSDPDAAEKLEATLCAWLSASIVDKIVAWES